MESDNRKAGGKLFSIRIHMKIDPITKMCQNRNHFVQKKKKGQHDFLGRGLLSEFLTYLRRQVFPMLALYSQK